VSRRHQQVAHLGRLVHQGEQVQVVRADLALGEHALAQPVHQPAPVVGVEQDHGELRDLARLREREGLEQLVEGAEAAGEDHEAARVAHEHDLAGEEVVELERYVAVGVAALLERQLDVEPDRAGTGVPRPAVGRLHDSGPAAGDDREPALTDEAGGLAREGVLGVVRGRPGRAEEGCRGADSGERVEPGSQLVGDALEPVLVGERRSDRRLLGGDDLLVEGAGFAGHGQRRLDGRRSLIAGHPGSPFPPRKVQIGTTPLPKKQCRRDGRTWSGELDDLA